MCVHAKCQLPSAPGSDGVLCRVTLACPHIIVRFPGIQPEAAVSVTLILTHRLTSVQDSLSYISPNLANIFDLHVCNPCARNET